jgi:hypothetical protein
MFKLRGESGKMSKHLFCPTNDTGNTDYNDRYRLKQYLNIFPFTNALFSASLSLSYRVTMQLQVHSLYEVKLHTSLQMTCRFYLARGYLVTWWYCPYIQRHKLTERRQRNPWKCLRVIDLGSQISRHQPVKAVRLPAESTDHLYSQEIFLVLICVERLSRPQGRSAAGRMIPSGIEPATLQLVAQYLK